MIRKTGVAQKRMFPRVGVIVYLTPETMALVDEECQEKQREAGDGKRVPRSAVVMAALDVYLGTGPIGEGVDSA